MMADLNYLAIVAAVVTAFIASSVWYVVFAFPVVLLAGSVIWEGTEWKSPRSMPATGW
jgi:hypothetical protein